MVQGSRRRPQAGRGPQNRTDQEAAQERRAERLEDIHEKLTAGVERIGTGEGWKQMLRMSARLHNYSWGNLVLLMMQNPDVTHVAGFNKWKELGRSVRKGEKALYVLAPMKYREDEANEQTGQTEKVTRIRGWKPVPVFDITQTDGPDLPMPTRLTGDAPQALWDAVMGVLTEKGYRVELTEIPGGAKGDTSTDGVVRIDSRLAPREKLAVAVHELSHIANGHIEDIGEYRQHRSRFECEAESTAFVVMTALGVDVGDWSGEYVLGWVQGDIEVLRATADKVVKTSQNILDSLAPVGLELEEGIGLGIEPVM